MAGSPFLVFDFDGVLVDGMAEYWWAASAAAERLVPGLAWPEPPHPAFVRLRPLIHKGWEMVLMAAELSRPDLDLDGLVAGYREAVPQALARWGWSEAQLQGVLEQVRTEAIATDPAAWLALHRFYPNVVERVRQLEAEGSSWAVLTTKGAAFAREILRGAGLEPQALYGHDQGSKPEVLRRLQADHSRLWFVEDRRPTLERVAADPELNAVRCFLVSWGYLGRRDALGLPARIHWLTPERFAAPLATWP